MGINPQKTQSNPNRPDISPPALASGELGKVQELLFGKQLQSNSDQLKTLQLYFDQQLAVIREEYSSQVVDMRAQLDSTLAEVKQKLQRDEAGFTDKLTQSNLKLTRVEQRLDAKLVELDERLTKDILVNNKDIRLRVDDAIRTLNDKKMDRGALSNLLGDVASQLAHQSTAQSSQRVDAIDTEKNESIGVLETELGNGDT